MKIILFGNEGTGKTYLAKTLEKVGFRYEHFGAPKNKEEAMEQVDKYLELLLSPENVVLDRSWVCGVAYDNYLNRPSFIGDTELELMTKVAKQQKAEFVFCGGDATCDGKITLAYVKRLEARGEELFDGKSHAETVIEWCKIQASYVDAIAKLGIGDGLKIYSSVDA